MFWSHLEDYLGVILELSQNHLGVIQPDSGAILNLEVILEFIWELCCSYAGVILDFIIEFSSFNLCWRHFLKLDHRMTAGDNSWCYTTGRIAASLLADIFKFGLLKSLSIEFFVLTSFEKISIFLATSSWFPHHRGSVPHGRCKRFLSFWRGGKALRGF